MLNLESETSVEREHPVSNICCIYKCERIVFFNCDIMDAFSLYSIHMLFYLFHLGKYLFHIIIHAKG